MPANRTNLKIVHLPLAIIVQVARDLACREEYKSAETLLRWALAWDESDASARRWLEFVLEAQNKFEEAYRIHIQKQLGSMVLRSN